MTKAQQIYDQVEQIVAAGGRKADAFRQIADELGQPVNSIRGSYYTHTRTMGGGGQPRSRRRETTSATAIESATLVLQKAIDSIDLEIAAAKTRVDEAKAEYEQLRDSAAERKASIQTKIDALTS